MRAPTASNFSSAVPDARFPVNKDKYWSIKRRSMPPSVSPDLHVVGKKVPVCMRECMQDQVLFCAKGDKNEHSFK
jgi:hypothetical protein